MDSEKKNQNVSRQERKAKRRKLIDAVPDLPSGIDAEDFVELLGKRQSNISMDEGEFRKKRREEEKAVTKDPSLDSQMKLETTGKNDITLADSPTEQGQSTATVSRRIGRHVELSSNSPKPDTTAPYTSSQGRKSKKERKAERRAQKPVDSSEAMVTYSLPDAVVEHQPDSDHGAKAGASKDKTKKIKSSLPKRSTDAEIHNITRKRNQGTETESNTRFICFVGNLPFTANYESILAHFEALKPKAVRPLTDREDPTKSRGVAFIEFDGYDHMKTCLSTYHHSLFDDGISAPRRLNVELTAGGGGNTKDRKAKIQEKNAKLQRQRASRMQEEQKIKRLKRTDSIAIDEISVHPSRRNQVPVA